MCDFSNTFLKILPIFANNRLQLFVPTLLYRVCVNPLRVKLCGQDYAVVLCIGATVCSLVTVVHLIHSVINSCLVCDAIITSTLVVELREAFEKDSKIIGQTYCIIVTG